VTARTSPALSGLSSSWRRVPLSGSSHHRGIRYDPRTARRLREFRHHPVNGVLYCLRRYWRGCSFGRVFVMSNDAAHKAFCCGHMEGYILGCKGERERIVSMMVRRARRGYRYGRAIGGEVGKAFRVTADHDVFLAREIYNGYPDLLDRSESEAEPPQTEHC
jgi:hypothetical protein